MSEGISINRLLSFLQVANHSSLARAAPGDPIRRSQLSRQVGELERHFGKALIERSGRGIVVTPAGELLAGVVRELEKGFDAVRAEDGEAPVLYTLGAGDSLLQWWVVPRIAEVTNDVPRAVASLVSLSSADVETQLHDARLDFGIVRGKTAPKGLESRPLRVLEYALYVPRKLRSKVPTGNIAELLCTVPLALQQSEPALNEELVALAAKHGTLHVALKCETFPQAYSAVCSERYAALLPTIADIHLPHRKVAEVKLPGLGRVTAKLHLAWHARTTRRGGSLRRVANALEECLLREDE